MTTTAQQQTAQPQQWDSNAQLKERFFRYFQHEVTALQEQMERLSDTSVAGGERTDAIDHCLAGIARLSREVNDVSSYIPAYDQRTYAEAIKALSEKFQRIRNNFAPRPKFAFKAARKNPSAISLTDAAALATQQRSRVSAAAGQPSDPSTAESNFAPTPAQLRTPTNERMDGDEDEDEDEDDYEGDGCSQGTRPSALSSSEIRKPSFSGASSVSISNQSNVHIILPSSAAHATTSGTLSNLKHCIVDLSVPTASGRPFAGLTGRNVKSSLLVTGHVSGPLHITNVSNSVIVAACKQFRMHECSNVDVYLHCSSRPIIEDCEAIRFAPLPEPYQLPSSSSPKATPSSAPPPNLWNKIDDFKWLKAEPSPHWKELPSAERIKDDVWRDIVPGGPGLSLAEILRAVGVELDGRW